MENKDNKNLESKTAECGGVDAAKEILKGMRICLCIIFLPVILVLGGELLDSLLGND